MQLLILAITSSSTQRHIGSPPGGVTAWQAVGCTSRDLGFNSVCYLQGSKHTYIAGLQLVRSMGGKSTEDDVVREAKGHHFQRLVWSKAIADEDAWLAVCTGTCRWIKDMSNPV